MKTFLIIFMACFAAHPNSLFGKVSFAFEKRNSASEIQIERNGERLSMAWELKKNKRAKITFGLRSSDALIESLRFESGKASKTILQRANPDFQLFIGERNLAKNKWTVFFDNPDTRPYSSGRLKLDLKDITIDQLKKRATVKFGNLSFEDFSGQLWLTVYAGSPLVHLEAVIKTEKQARAIVYAAGLSLPEESVQSIRYHRAGKSLESIDKSDLASYREWKHVELNRNDGIGRSKFKQKTSLLYGGKDAGFLKAKYRAVGVELEGGSLTVFPSPHKFLYPLDFAENFGGNYAWRKKGIIETGIRQPPLGDGRYRPWVNAPPKTAQHLDLFFLVSDDGPYASLAEVKNFTNDDRFPELNGYKRFSSHYHFWHTRSLIKEQKRLGTDEIPEPFKAPPFVAKIKEAGIDVIHLAEFHGGPRTGESRLTELQKLHEECKRLSDGKLLVLPGEEPNCHLGGHWISFFPRPVHWIFGEKEIRLAEKSLGLKTAGKRFVHRDAKLGAVYFIHSAADVLKLMEAEDGLMWTAHPRIKSSTGYPDKYKGEAFYQSPHYLGAAWKAMPADYSRDRLGERVLDLLDDMNDWGQPKMILGEADLFELNKESELYGHLNVNYLKMDKLPRFEEGWDEVLETLRKGRYFTSTGEVLIPSLRINGKEFAKQATPDEGGKINLEVELRWTFPLSFAEIIGSDGKKTYRERIELSETSDFGTRTVRHAYSPKKDLKWFRFEVWDVAENGAFTQPVYLNRP
ncbi:MAG: hypothetical protein CMD87_00105 [Gammaproteobacteria bacterium]|nr:hypothetical protein [Gammaproteobacteria bacterium]